MSFSIQFLGDEIFILYNDRLYDVELTEDEWKNAGLRYEIFPTMTMTDIEPSGIMKTQAVYLELSKFAELSRPFSFPAGDHRMLIYFWDSVLRGRTRGVITF